MTTVIGRGVLPEPNNGPPANPVRIPEQQNLLIALGVGPHAPWVDLAQLRLRASALNCLCTQLGRGPRVDIARESRLGAPPPQEFYQAVVYTRSSVDSESQLQHS